MEESSAKVSVMLLTRNRSEPLRTALTSIVRQTFTNYELVVVNDGSTDETSTVLAQQSKLFTALRVITHATPLGITRSRQEALLAARGKYIAVLDDDDHWVDQDKLAKEVDYLDAHPRVVLVGGGIAVIPNGEHAIDNKVSAGTERMLFRPAQDKEIRQSMLFRNNFFTSTVMFRKQVAVDVGGFLSDGIDLAEDYDLWLRLGLRGEMHNFSEVFARYSAPAYNKQKFQKFLRKQAQLITLYRNTYPYFLFARTALILRLLL